MKANQESNRAHGIYYHVMGWNLEEFSLEVTGRWRMRWRADGEPVLERTGLI